MIGKVFPYIPFYFQSDTIQLEVHAVEIGTDEIGVCRSKKLKIHFCAFNHLFPSCKSFDQKLVLVQERFLSQSLVQRRMERI